MFQLYTVISAKRFGTMKQLNSEHQMEDAALLSKVSLRDFHPTSWSDC